MIFSKRIRIGESVIDKASKTFIIAEAGVNHNGDLERAREMIDVACESGVDAIKFQSFIAKELILANVDLAAYQKENLQEDGSQFKMLKKLEVPVEKMLALKQYAEKRGLVFLTTPFDQISLDLLDVCDLNAYKIASTDATNLMFLRKIAAKGKPILLSTGMTYFTEIEYVLQELSKINQDIILLHCTSDYPTPPSEVNLEILNVFKEKFKVITGFSDHTQGIGASPYALMFGAKVIEKHFTLDKTLSGPDHVASLEPSELSSLVKTIREAETFIGQGLKYPSIGEVGTRASLQKCIVARKEIKQGEIFEENDLNAKRTGGFGIPALYVDKIIGRVAIKDYNVDDLIEI